MKCEFCKTEIDRDNIDDLELKPHYHTDERCRVVVHGKLLEVEHELEAERQRGARAWEKQRKQILEAEAARDVWKKKWSGSQEKVNAMAGVLVEMRTTFKLNAHAQEWADFIEERVEIE